MSDWTDQIVGERMAVDNEFSQRVVASEFSNQEWSLIMTAVEFEIEDADDPDRARIVADTSKLDAIMPELENIRTQMGGVPGAPGAGQDRSKGGGGLFDGIKNALGLDGDDEESDDKRKEAAAELAQEYATALQEHLEEKGRWDEVRTIGTTD
ncbi:MAG TPA: DUF5799 family protein [Natrialbaceae archaeon]|nr:DUF5799 family protein [Natrialbaceae archaeon]